MKIPILGTGLSGLVGSRIIQLLADEYDFSDLSLESGVDISNIDQVMEKFKSSSAKTVIHMAAKTDVDSCEDDKIYGEEGASWLVNVIGTENIIRAAKKYNKRIIYISTDFVFDGTKEFYQEEDTPNPVNWYGYTKFEGEKRVLNGGISYCIIRLAYPYRASFAQKLDFVRKIIERAKKKEKIFALTDHIFTPTFIDDIAEALRLLIKRQIDDIFHVVGGSNIPPYEATRLILKTFNLKVDIEKVIREEYFRNRAFRPFKLALKNDKITGLGAKMKTFAEGLLELKRQLI